MWILYGEILKILKDRIQKHIYILIAYILLRSLEPKIPSCLRYFVIVLRTIFSANFFSMSSSIFISDSGFFLSSLRMSSSKKSLILALEVSPSTAVVKKLLIGNVPRLHSKNLLAIARDMVLFSYLHCV